MGSNSFGTLFKITTWGESHGPAIGVVIDGCPAGLEISEAEVLQALSERAPGKSPYTSPRQEKDEGTILSGVFEGKTTGAPISILIPNHDVDSSKYEPIKHLLRPGHATYTYLKKYGIFDGRGGGRSSGRETACRVAAGVFAKKLLAKEGIEVVAYIKQIADLSAIIEKQSLQDLRKETYQSPIFCPDTSATKAMCALLDKVKSEDDSVGGIVEFIAVGLPAGLGDPIYEKLEAKFAYAMLSIPSTKGFEIGSGFVSAEMKGSEHNDRFISQDGKILTETNHAGGTLGGISTGMPVVGRVAFKPPSSIMKEQQTLTVDGEKAIFQLPANSRHDPCVAIRAVPVVEAMCALVIADALLMNRSAKI